MSLSSEFHEKLIKTKVNLAHIEALFILEGDTHTDINLVSEHELLTFGRS